MINYQKIGRASVRLSPRSIMFCVVAIVAVLCGLGCEIVNEDLPSYEQTSIVKVGDKAPELDLLSVDGEPVVVGGMSDEPTLLILFSHTCPDCKALLDDLQSRIGSGVEMPRVVAVSRGGYSEEIVAYRDENGYTFTIVAAAREEAFVHYATMYVPRCYIIDCEGVVQYMTIEYDESYIDDLLAVASKL